ncbi:YeeE/YedE thiosulfate transporter family protein [Draconibacterium sp. IB214405]|uniref:YeeE/YedE thiosulfate transporter family protein n=1 Tax=Draconibacterium sp. IB214405 TaxID=3097352 RepID=UPI002A0CF6D7|nr:YeeE/YedE thiosulfate transporter family protein [Draconibacterium sp. IB214405]MDX8338352.1 YeeE/YedE thiosulfate transporter family protein [Draconibacterium sp. IB214405]
MSSDKTNIQEPKYINPYLGGVLLGLLIIVTVFITGRGLGASGAIKSAVVTTSNTIAPKATEANTYMCQFIGGDHSPMWTWLVFESLGVLLGGIISGIVFGRMKKFRTDHGPRITSKKRLVLALIGGALFGLGSQFGRGCTSGAALSGTATFALGGVIVMFAIFGTGYAVAYFFRKFWI